jgi:6-phosphogluconolactonase
MTLAIRRFQNLNTLSKEAAGFVIDSANYAVQKKGIFTIVLSGGKSPRVFYDVLAREPFNTMMPWDQTHIFWGDERWVPSGHPENNFSMAYDAFIAKTDIAPGNIHRIGVDSGSPDEAATAYEDMVKDFFQSHCASGASSLVSHENLCLPIFDLILLGVGSDGHTASLFPGEKALEEKKRLYVAVPAAQGSPPTQRITLTLPLINNANCVMFLVSGSGKKKVVYSMLSNPKAASSLYPAAMVHPRGDLLWFIDEQTT